MGPVLKCFLCPILMAALWGMYHHRSCFTDEETKVQRSQGHRAPQWLCWDSESGRLSAESVFLINAQDFSWHWGCHEGSEVSKKPTCCFLPWFSWPRRSWGVHGWPDHRLGSPQWAGERISPTLCQNPFPLALQKNRSLGPTNHGWFSQIPLSPSGKEKAILILQAPMMVNLPLSGWLCQLRKKQTTPST